MFWNTEFLDSSPSHIDVLLQMQTVKLSDILFEDDLLQELKTSNLMLEQFLMKPEILAELIDNITRLTEKDCCDKLLYSRVHAAYISCEILTNGSSEIFTAFMYHPESLSKIISCLTLPASSHEPLVEEKKSNEKENNEEVEDSSKKLEGVEVDENPDKGGENQVSEDGEKGEIIEDGVGEEDNKGTVGEPKGGLQELESEGEIKVENHVGESADETETRNANTDNSNEAKVDDETEDDISGSKDTTISTNNIEKFDFTKTKVVPQKATLVSKLISTIHSLAAAKLSCHITQDITSFSRLINLLVHNIDISGSFEILSTFIKHTTPPELRYVFCEILSKLDFALSLISVMTLSSVEDKQRNACQLLCDIIVIGRQEASEQYDSGPMAQDMLVGLLESEQAVRVILEQMFSEDMKNQTAIICGMKVLQTLIEQKPSSDEQILAWTIKQTQDEIEKHLHKLHELLINPPKQDPIRTTFGIIQKPLGYMRLEAVNLIRALISTNSPIIIKKLVDLKTMKVIIDLFIEYSWNNLLHTQVEQSLCLIINNYRHDEEVEDSKLRHNHLMNITKLSDYTDYEQQPEEDRSSSPNENEQGGQKGDVQHLDSQDGQELEQKGQQARLEGQQSEASEPIPATEIPSRALLSQLLNECDLIGRLLAPNSLANNNNITSTLTIINNNNNNLNRNDQENKNLHEVDINETDKVKTEVENDDKENISQPDGNIKHEKNTSLADISNSSEDLRKVELERHRRRIGDQANFGHIIQIINSVAINRDLDVIRDHLNEIQDKRSGLYDRWTTFVNVDVASFKEISVYYDAQSANNNVSHRCDNRTQDERKLIEDFNRSFDALIDDHKQPERSNNLPKSEESEVGKHIPSDDEQHLTYMEYEREMVIPAINVNVLPRSNRRHPLTRPDQPSDTARPNQRDIRGMYRNRDYKT